MHYSKTRLEYFALGFFMCCTLVQGMFLFGESYTNIYGFKSALRCACSCGQANTRHVSRLLGGTTAQINEFPWSVALLYKGHYFCGGTLINERYVLTAAHCIKGMRPKDLKVLVGEHMRSFPLESRMKVHSVVYSIFHHKFNHSTFNNDIALLKLTPKVKYRWYARPACLPFPKTEYVGQLGIVTGWGKIGEEEFPADSLQKIKIPIFSNKQCKDLLYYPEEITDNMVCAGYPAGWKDSCHGDSGGGLLWQGRDRKYDVVGIVSWGHGCGRNGYPGVYTRVSKYLSWIAFHTRDTCYCGRRMPRLL